MLLDPVQQLVTEHVVQIRAAVDQVMAAFVMNLAFYTVTAATTMTAYVQLALI